MTKLPRHQKQKVRAYIRLWARKSGRTYRGIRGTDPGVRFFIQDANRKMAEGMDAMVHYPQDKGAGVISVRQILRQYG